jgi:hypothetical protein
MSTESERTVEERRAIRKEAADQIDPETAEVFWMWGSLADPYGEFPDLPEKYHHIGRLYYARSPGSHVWVEFGDLPESDSKGIGGKAASRTRPAALGRLMGDQPRERATAAHASRDVKGHRGPRRGACHHGRFPQPAT